MILTESNYYSPEANLAYFSVSQYKDFLKCPAMAIAKLKGEYEEEPSRALLLGSYVDEQLTGTEESRKQFVIEHAMDLFKKNGDRYADILQADQTIVRIKKQPLMMKYLSGRHQVIMTGEIEGVPFKIKMDNYKPNEFISDCKYMASLRSPNMFEPMVKYWGYDIQGAVYQEIVYQNTGKRLPFYLDITTKETPAHLVVAEIKQYDLDEALEIVKALAPRFQAIKNGETEPNRCGEYDCNYCTETTIITEPVDSNYLGMSQRQIKAANGDFI